MKIVKQKTVSSQWLSDFDREINSLLQQGYQLLGEIVVADAIRGYGSTGVPIHAPYYTQRMVMYDE